MPYCWVKGCGSGSRRSKFRVMFRFPNKDKHPELAEEWWVRVNRPEAATMDVKTLTSRYVCGLHFHSIELEDKLIIPLVINNQRIEHEYERSRFHLKRGSVPSILPGPGSLKKIRDLRSDDMGKRYCCVDSCPNRKCTSSLLSIFLPPKDSEQFATWKKVVQPHRRLPFTRTTGVCELHFQPSDILREFVTKLRDGTVHTLPRGRVSLAPGVYPTLFGKDLKKMKKSSCIEVKAPSTSKKEVTYIFDVGDDDEPEEENVTITDDNIEMEVDEPELAVEEEKPVKRQRGRPRTLVDVDRDEGDGIECSETFDVIDDDGNGNDDRGNSVVDAEEDDPTCFKVFDEDEECPTDSPIAEPPQFEVSQENAPEYKGTLPPNESCPDLRQILNNDDDGPHKSNIDEAFSSLCRTYIVSKVNKRGQKSNFEMRSSPPEKKRANPTEEEVFIYPTTNNLDVKTLLYNIDRVEYPSDSWFCTIREGAPAFLCWGLGYKITKKVIFNSQNLHPTILIGESEVKLSEVIRPRSIKEVGSILKLADAVELCNQYSDMVRPYTNCKGYFFRTQADDPNITHCLVCRFQKKAQPIETKLNSQVTFEEICQAAESLVEDRELWSYTIIGTAIVFLRWWKQYRIDKLFIVSRDISTKILMGDEFVTIDEVKYVKTLSDIAAALDFLGKCRKCLGIRAKEPKIEKPRRAVDCRGYVSGDNLPARISRCSTCVDIRNKVRLRNYRQRLKGQFVRCSKDLYPPLKCRTSSLDKTSFEEELSVEDDELSDEGWLVDVLENVRFPSNAWSYVVVDNSIIFQNWDDSLVVSKKIIINPDLNVQIYVLDNHVEIEAVQSVENVDDVMRLLNIVDCIEICDGVDDTKRKSEGCTGYYYDPDAKIMNAFEPKRCPKCAKEHLIYSRREQKWMKRIAMGQADLTPSGDIKLNVKKSSVLEVAEGSPSNTSKR